jgi:hypothetical protein
MAPPPKSFLCFSRAITYVEKQRKLFGSGAITDGETDAKNASVDGPLDVSFQSDYKLSNLPFEIENVH